MTQIVAAVLALLGTVVTVVVTALVTRARVRRDLESSYDISLRAERLAAYRELWRALQPLAKYSRPGPVTYRLLGRLSPQLRAWYFETGGLFLSTASREAYFALMDELRERLLRRPVDTSAELEFPYFERLRQLGSDLRSAMVEDVQTRRGSALARE